MQEEARTRKAGQPRWLRNLGILLVLAIALAAIDLGIKWAVFRSHRAERTFIPHFLYLQRARNTGGLFGIGREHSALFVLLSAITIGLVVWMYLAFGQRLWLTRVALAFVLGGALGNLWDRARLGYVRDFLLIQVGRFRWPNFNLADVWICIGAAALLGWMLNEPGRRRAKNPPKESAPTLPKRAER